ncbi:hypothetical protein SEPCBS57363_001442 [Sporothrix epigloea]|uniref:Uncharacterized protein n=1 Tax=Sporothrix epigloea TaxID=1892477 RepID=A0ABP0DBZ8_9PEZI
MAPHYSLSAYTAPIARMTTSAMDLAHAEFHSQHLPTVTSLGLISTSSVSSTVSSTLTMLPSIPDMPGFVGTGATANGHQINVAVIVIFCVVAVILLAAAYGMTRHLQKMESDNTTMGNNQPRNIFRMQRKQLFSGRHRRPPSLELRALRRSPVYTTRPAPLKRLPGSRSWNMSSKNLHLDSSF